MASGRARSPNREKAFELWRKAKGKITDKEIAEKLGVSRSFITRWRHEDAWSENVTKNFRIKRNTKKGKRFESQGGAYKQKNPLSTIKLKDGALDDKQKKFCLYFMQNHNATQAYLKAYECSYETANSCAYRMLVNVGIQAEIERMRKLQQAELLIDQNDIVLRYMHMAFADMHDFVRVDVDDKGNTGVKVAPSGITDGGIIKEIKESKQGISIKLESRTKALDWLAKYFLANPLDRHKIEYDNAMLKSREKSSGIDIMSTMSQARKRAEECRKKVSKTQLKK